MQTLRCLAVLVAGVVCSSFPAQAQDQPVEVPAAEKGGTSPPTYEVVREPFSIDLTVEAMFEPAEKAEVELRPERWTDLEVVDAVKHGAQVQKGDTLLTLDLEELDDSLSELRGRLQLTSSELHLAEEKLEYTERSQPLELERKEVQSLRAQADLARFLEIEQELSRKSADLSLESSEFRLREAEEELRQLEKMYEADDLTEETEEFILKRYRFQVKRARFYLENQKVRHDKTLTISLPRKLEDLQRDAAGTALDREHAETSHPLTLRKLRLQYEHLKREREKLQEQLDDLTADRELLAAIAAPMDGILYYGRFEKGAWLDASELDKELRKGGKLPTEKVILTLLHPRPLIVRAAIPQEELHYFRVGLAGKALPTGYPDLRLPVELTMVSELVTPDGNFYAVFRVEADEQAKVVQAAMNCTLRFTPYKKAQALTAPVKAVFEDELDPDRYYVYVYRKDAQPEKRYIRRGKKNNEKIEILEGLEEGEIILTEKPEALDDE